MVSVFALLDSFQTNLKSAQNAPMFQELSWLTELVLFAQENSFTMVKDAAVQLVSPKLEPRANKLARMINLLMKMEFATDVQSTRSSRMEDAPASAITSETTAPEFVNFRVLPLNSNTREDVLSVL
jgi:hypothetical protein